MIDFSHIVGFEWDKGNIDKSYIKHGITPQRTEEVFLDNNVLLQADIKYQENEDRYIAIGECFDGLLLFVVFTFRKNYIRVISGRPANKNERKIYEQRT